MNETPTVVVALISYTVIVGTLLPKVKGECAEFRKFFLLSRRSWTHPDEPRRL